MGDKLFLKAIVGEKMSTDKHVEVEKWFSALGRSLLEPLAPSKPRDPKNLANESQENPPSDAT